MHSLFIVVIFVLRTIMLLLFLTKNACHIVLTYLNKMSKDDYQSDIVNRYADFCKICNISVDNKEERSLVSYIASSNHSQIIDTSSPILKEVRANFRRNDYDFIFKNTSGYQLRRT